MADTRLQSVLRNLSESFQSAFTEDRQDWDRAYREERILKGKTEDAPRFSQMAATYPTSVRIRENLGIADSDAMSARQGMNMGLEKGADRRAGQMFGTLAQDVVQDKGRSFYWLLNAIQATGGVIAEETIGRMVPELYKQSPVRTARGKNITTKMPRAAKEQGLIKDSSEPYRTTRGVKVVDGNYVKDDYSGGMKAAAALLPTGIAINTGIGLMTPMGGAEGYKAIFPDDEDPNKSTDVLMEVAAKYLMGRTGNLLPFEEFQKVRPDVSRDEYNEYKAHKFSKGLDLNPTDGDIIGPMGIFKAKSDGIHGPEVELLGKTLPATTGVVPFATALAGGVLGGRAGVGRGRAASGALLGGLGGTAGGMTIGNLLEAERRRRGEEEQDRISMGYVSQA